MHFPYIYIIMINFITSLINYSQPPPICYVDFKHLRLLFILIHFHAYFYVRFPFSMHIHVSPTPIPFSCSIMWLSHDCHIHLSHDLSCCLLCTERESTLSQCSKGLRKSTVWKIDVNFLFSFRNSSSFFFLRFLIIIIIVLCTCMMFCVKITSVCVESQILIFCM